MSMRPNTPRRYTNVKNFVSENPHIDKIQQALLSFTGIFNELLPSEQLIYGVVCKENQENCVRIKAALKASLTAYKARLNEYEVYKLRKECIAHMEKLQLAYSEYECLLKQMITVDYVCYLQDILQGDPSELKFTPSETLREQFNEFQEKFDHITQKITAYSDLNDNDAISDSQGYFAEQLQEHVLKFCFKTTNGKLPFKTVKIAFEKLLERLFKDQEATEKNFDLATLDLDIQNHKQMIEQMQRALELDNVEEIFQQFNGLSIKNHAFIEGFYKAPNNLTKQLIRNIYFYIYKEHRSEIEEATDAVKHIAKFYESICAVLPRLVRNITEKVPASPIKTKATGSETPRTIDRRLRSQSVETRAHKTILLDSYLYNLPEACDQVVKLIDEITEREQSLKVKYKLLFEQIKENLKAFKEKLTQATTDTADAAATDFVSRGHRRSKSHNPRPPTQGSTAGDIPLWRKRHSGAEGTKDGKTSPVPSLKMTIE